MRLDGMRVVVWAAQCAHLGWDTWEGQGGLGAGWSCCHEKLGNRRPVRLKMCALASCALGDLARQDAAKSRHVTLLQGKRLLLARAACAGAAHPGRPVCQASGPCHGCCGNCCHQGSQWRHSRAPMNAFSAKCWLQSGSETLAFEAEPCEWPAP